MNELNISLSESFCIDITFFFDKIFRVVSYMKINEVDKTIDNLDDDED